MKIRPMARNQLLAKLCARTDTRGGDDIACWFWRGACWTSASGQYPVLWWDGGTKSVRRLWFELVSGRRLRAGHQLRSSCSASCVRPDHMVDYTRSAALGSISQVDGYTILWRA